MTQEEIVKINKKIKASKRDVLILSVLIIGWYILFYFLTPNSGSGNPWGDLITTVVNGLIFNFFLYVLLASLVVIIISLSLSLWRVHRHLSKKKLNSNEVNNYSIKNDNDVSINHSKDIRKEEINELELETTILPAFWKSFKIFFYFVVLFIALMSLLMP